MKLTDKTPALISFIVIAIFLAVIQLLSTGVSGETDSIFHYQIARYAFKYPDFFLVHWGKPLFTILSAPLSQFGYTGAIAFNLLSGLLSGWFAWLIARKLDYRHAWAAIFFTVFTPVYLFIMFSALTEILFSLVLIASIYLFISRRFIWSAIVISLIPFARTEGVMFIVLFIPALLWMRQYKALPFLLSGFIVFGFLGLPIYHDFMWFFTKMPYSTGSAGLYGSGSFLDYFGEMDYILNYPLIILTVTGLIYMTLDLKKGIKDLRNIKYATLYFLIIPSVFGFILAQSFLWWKGLGVLFSIRFMACILPLAAILAVAGFDWLLNRARPVRLLYWAAGIFILALVVVKPFTYRVLPSKTSVNFAVMQQLTAWLKESPYAGRKASYNDPMFPFYMNIDPFDSQKCDKVYSWVNKDPATRLKYGELLVWDPQFTGYEGSLPFDSLFNNENFRLLKTFTPAVPFKIIGGEQYRLALFMRAPRDTSRGVFQQFYFNGFEKGVPESLTRYIATGISSSGAQSLMLTTDNVFSPPAEDKLMNLPDTGKIYVKTSVRILNPSPTDKGTIILVVSTEDPAHQVQQYVVAKDSDVEYRPDEWFTLTRTDLLDRHQPPGGSYKVYVWYKGKNKIYIDDLKLEFLPADF